MKAVAALLLALAAVHAQDATSDGQEATSHGYGTDDYGRTTTDDYGRTTTDDYGRTTTDDYGRTTTDDYGRTTTYDLPGSTSESSIYDLCAQWFDRSYRIPSNIESYRQRYEDYLKKFRKSYSTHEKECRLRVYAQNLVRMENRRRRHSKAVFGENKFTDWTREEKKKLFNGGRRNQGGRTTASPRLRSTAARGYTAPTQVDWVAAGKVNPPKDQGNCGCCWAFSTVAAVESAYMIKNNVTVSLSEQQLTDCDRDWDAGCNGGNPWVAMGYVIDNGLSSEADYPYNAKDNEQCQVVNDSKIFISDRQILPANAKTQQQWIAQHGPVAIAISPVPEALMDLFSFYGSDVASVFVPAGNCTEEVLDGGHAMTAVGYGTEDGVDYWLIKNSWGSNWGDNGYVKFVRGINACGIESEMVAPIIN